MGRLGTAEEIAAVAVYLASDDQHLQQEQQFLLMVEFQFN
jgi:NAD(P)-dependent dehydrogenase (short-subunit alcohol dehydrogenase family)